MQNTYLTATGRHTSVRDGYIDELPPLPEPYNATEDDDGTVTEYFTDKDLKTYAQAVIAPYKTEIESLRTMLNTYNLGGWSDSHAILKRAENAEAEVERLKAGGCTRDQGLTQYCAEAAEFANRIRKVQELLAFIKDQDSTPLWIVDLIDAAQRSNYDHTR